MMREFIGDVYQVDAKDSKVHEVMFVIVSADHESFNVLHGDLVHRGYVDSNHSHYPYKTFLRDLMTGYLKKVL